MSGAGTAAGIVYQAEVGAYFAVEMLAGRWDTRWSLDADSQIERVWCEGPEPVDDVSLLVTPNQLVLIQAKRSAALSARPTSPLGEAMRQFVAVQVSGGAPAEHPARLVLMVGRRGSRRVVEHLGTVLDRARAADVLDQRLLCRTATDEEALKKTCDLARKYWRDAVDVNPSDHELLGLLKRIWVTQLDVEADGTDRGRALDRLGALVADPDNREAAWMALVQHFSVAQKKQAGGTRSAVARVLDRLPATRLRGTVQPGPARSDLERDYLIAQHREVEVLRAEVLGAQVGENVPRMPLDDTFVPLRAELSLGHIQAQLLAALPRRERRLIELRLGLHGGRPRTLRAVGSIFGIASYRVRQIEVTVLRALDEELQRLLTGIPGAELRTGRAPTQLLDVLRGRALTVPVLDLIAEQPRLAVTGDPGSGKSSILRYLVWRLSGDGSGADESVRDIPIHLAFSDYARSLATNNGLELDEALVRAAGRFAEVVRIALADGRALVLLDGLDEVVETGLRGLVAQRLNRFLTDPAYDDVRVVVTSRILGYRPEGALKDLPTVKLSPFDDEEVDAFLAKWFVVRRRDEPNLDVAMETTRLAHRLSADQRLKELARTPLLLTLIALVDKRHGDLPNIRVSLYATAFETLLHVWPLYRTHAQINQDVAPMLLEPVAQRVFEQPEEEGVPDPEVVRLLARAYSEIAPVGHAAALTEARQLLDLIEQHSGVLISRGRDAQGVRRWAFVHRVFAEYLTARKLSSDWLARRARLTFPPEPQWSEVLLMAAGELARQRPAFTGEFVQALQHMRSTPWEDRIARDLQLALGVFAAGISVAGADAISDLFHMALRVRRTTPLDPLRRDIDSLLMRLRGGPYSYLITGCLDESNDAKEIVELAQLIGAELLTERLEPLLSEESELSAEAALELSIADPSRALELLGERTPHLVVAEQFVSAGKLVAEQDPDRGAELFDYGARSSELDRAADCVNALAAMPPPYALRGLCILLDAPDVLRFVIDALGTLGDPDTPKALELLVADDPSRRWGAVEALDKRPDASAIDAVRQVMRSGEPDRLDAAAYLYTAADNADAREVLESALNTKSWRSRVLAADALARSACSEAIAVLTSALTNAPLEDRVTAAEVLMTHGQLELGLQTLVDLASGDFGPGVRRSAIEALARSESEDAVDALVGLLDAKDSLVAVASARALLDVGVPAGLGVLVAQTSDLQDPEVARMLYEVEEALPDEMLDLLEPLLRHGSGVQRRLAGELLPYADDEGTVALAIELLEDSEAAVRLGAARVLTYDDGTASEHALAERLGSLLADDDRPWDGTAHDPLFASVADTVYYALQRRDGLLKRALNSAKRPG